ncbi:hypothetical protein PAPYR_3122 [Paratrimastix pyriformis]|uniref:Hepatocellular carcinoma-associated antigen 59-domain-containing protein n=1 Tax=Paratrimastix pyriformis TaxID=342808 RepID=A0ABQ8UPV3_9EUKA|nr:hypothetical protein PAPYR_3122 [Paratrimastix pyriformis]
MPKQKHARHLRTTRALDELDKIPDPPKDEDEAEKIDVMKTIQKLRQKTTGIVVGEVAVEAAAPQQEHRALETTFQHETNLVGQDTRMEEFIEEELKKKREAEAITFVSQKPRPAEAEAEGEQEGKPAEGEDEEGREKRPRTDEEHPETTTPPPPPAEDKLETEADLYVTPSKYQAELPGKELVNPHQYSAQLAEVELPIDYKMRNMKETVEACRKLESVRATRRVQHEFNREWIAPASQSGVPVRATSSRARGESTDEQVLIRYKARFARGGGRR